MPSSIFDDLNVSKSHYELLGVSRSADVSRLRSAFRSLSKVLHPDTTTLPVDEAAHRFQQVCEAYETLSDPMRRKAYDDQLNQVTTKESAYKDDSLVAFTTYSTKAKAKEVRRAFSGSELFSLSLLGAVLLISLLLAIGFAFVQGRELQNLPTWLIVDRPSNNVIVQQHTNVSPASISYSA